MNFEIVYSDTIRLKTFDCITNLPIMVRKQWDWEFDWLPGEWYVLEIEWYDKIFFYNKEKGKFYLDFEDKEKAQALIEKHDKETEGMTKEESETYLEGKRINYRKRTEYILLVGDRNVNDIVKGLIEEYNI